VGLLYRRSLTLFRCGTKFSCLRSSAYLSALCGNAYFTAESQRYAEERRENLLNKRESAYFKKAESAYSLQRDTQRSRAATNFSSLRSSAYLSALCGETTVPQRQPKYAEGRSGCHRMRTSISANTFQQQFCNSVATRDRRAFGSLSAFEQ
jgi:hypothetical protein